MIEEFVKNTFQDNQSVVIAVVVAIVCFIISFKLFFIFSTSTWFFKSFKFLVFNMERENFKQINFFMFL